VTSSTNTNFARINRIAERVMVPLGFDVFDFNGVLRDRRDAYHHNLTMHFYGDGHHSGELSVLMSHMLLSDVCSSVIRS
jgi:hypothetical protein